MYKLTKKVKFVINLNDFFRIKNENKYQKNYWILNCQ